MAVTNNNTASIGFEQQIWAAADSELFEEEIKNRLGAIGYEF